MLTAREIMTTKIVTVTTRTSIKEVARIFVETNYSNLPVLDDDGDLVGVISETDLVEQQKPLHIPTVVALLDGVFYLDSEKRFEEEVARVTATEVGELIDKKLITCSPEQTVRELAGLMSKHSVHLLPVVEDGKMTGVVARLDLIKALEA